MLVVILFLAFIGMVVAGHILYAKAKQGEEVSSIHYWGYGLFSVLLLAVCITHFCTVGGAINLESQYYTYYTYSQDVRDNVLIINLDTLEGKLIPPGSGKDSGGTLSMDRLRSDVFNYNQGLYSIRHWANDPFVGIIIEKPNVELKPIILR